METLVLGIDEVGRGPLAGPMTVAGVVFGSDHHPNPAITDSKKIAAQKRTILAKFVQETALAFDIYDISPQEIDAQGLTACFCTAVTHIFESIHQAVPGTIEVIVDGKPIPQLHLPANVSFVVKGDQKIYAISAASIIAKVHRDTLMHDLAVTYPEYDWQSNVGYGTKAHRQALLTQGATPYHRQSFIKKLVARKPQ